MTERIRPSSLRTVEGNRTAFGLQALQQLRASARLRCRDACGFCPDTIAIG
jgi:hypothetical protein